MSILKRIVQLMILAILLMHLLSSYVSAVGTCVGRCDTDYRMCFNAASNFRETYHCLEYFESCRKGC